MTAFSSISLIVAALWFSTAIAVAVFIYRQKGDQRLRPELGFAFGGAGLLALAPCTYLATQFITGTPVLFGSVVQCVGAGPLFFAAAQARRHRLNPESAGSTRSISEKSALLTLAAVLLVFALYFVDTVGSSPEGAIAAFINAVILLVVIMVAGHIAIALFHSPHGELDSPADERDHEISRRSLRNAYYALAAGFWCMPVLIALPLPTQLALQCWLLLLVIAEVVYQGSIIRYYRAGIL